MGARMVEKERQRHLKKLEKKQRAAVLEPVASSSNESGTSNLNHQASVSSTSSKPLSAKTQFENERQRREMEFTLMRHIQEKAHTNRRWTSLVISGSIWLLLWFVGAAIFHASEAHPQEWSYFVSLYFAYTSLLTIGYGDFYPRSNAGKAFFVFWSLLAVPSLTVLISNMGDTIVKGIRDLTLWIGNFTVLPGEQGVKATIREGALKITGGKIGLFETTLEEGSEMPPGLLGETHHGRRAPDEGGNDKNDPEGAGQQASGDRADRETKRAAQQGKANDELPKSRRQFHVVLIKEVGKVMKHLQSSPPRKYTFEEWAWYLKLIGEDESSTQTHRRAPRKPQPDAQGAVGIGGASEGEEETERLEWSWVGNRSPLMGNKEEAEWVLERLTQTLERELEALRKEELEEKGGESAEDEEMTKDRAGSGNGPTSNTAAKGK